MADAATTDMPEPIGVAAASGRGRSGHVATPLDATAAGAGGGGAVNAVTTTPASAYGTASNNTALFDPIV